jgi:DNA-binding MarR family transcriptional regulator
VLTYTPPNTMRYGVQIGNAGQHYLNWRYGDRTNKRIAFNSTRRGSSQIWAMNSAGGDYIFMAVLWEPPLTGLLSRDILRFVSNLSAYRSSVVTWMDHNMSPTAQKLLRSFMRLSKVEWHGRSIAGSTMSEVKVLFCIWHGTCSGMPDMRVSEISKFLGVTSPTVTQLLKGMEAQDLVTRRGDPADRRSVGIALTEKGEKVRHQAVAALYDSLNGLIGYLGEEDSNRLADLLHRVFCYYNETPASAGREPRNGAD